MIGSLACALALAWIAMAPLPIAAVVGGAVVFAFLIDFAKVPAVKRLAFEGDRRV